MDNSAEQPIPYATPSPRRASPVMAGSAILLGGCFLIGTLIITEAASERIAAGQVSGMRTGEIVLLCVLYALAFACFAGALTMLFIGTRSLLRVVKQP